MSYWEDRRTAAFAKGLGPGKLKSQTGKCHGGRLGGNKEVPSGCVTLIIGTKNGDFLAKYRGDPLRASSCMKAYYPRKPPCGHHVHGRHGNGSPVKNRWIFWRFCKKYDTLTLTIKICILQDYGFNRSSHWSCLKACCKSYIFCFTMFLVRPSTVAQRRHERGPKKRSKLPWKIKVSSTIRSTFCLYASLHEDEWTSNFGKCLKMPQR